MKSVYIETTVVGNIAGRIHPNPLIAARQAVTRNWWSTALDRYDIFASELVVDECNAGDPTAVAERLLVLNGIRLIQSSSDTESLVDALMVAMLSQLPNRGMPRTLQLPRPTG